MKINQLKLLSAELQSMVPEFRQKKALFYIAPVDRILRAVHFDSSRWSALDFYVNVFFQPLYIPSEHLNLTNGFRLMPRERGKNWNVDDSVLQEELIERLTTEALVFLKKYIRVEDVLEYQNIQPNSDSVPRDFSFSLAAAGRFDEAANYLERGAELLDVSIEWQHARKLADLELASMCRSNPSMVNGRLAAYELENRAKHL
jgi:hypothetical protein